MRTFVQLKDGIGFATVNTEGETDGIEVEFGQGENYLKKIYNDGNWEPAPLIWFAEINYDGSIIEIRRTYYPSEVGDNPILTPDIKSSARWVNNEWVQEQHVEPISVITLPLEIEG